MRLSDRSLVGWVMGRGHLTNREWSLLEPHLPPLGGRGGRWNDHRTVVNGILFRVRTGVPWPDLPECYGSWKTVYEQHLRWSADGTWDRILQSVQAEADLAGRIDWSMVGVDSTSCRAHQHAAGARKARPWVPKKDAPALPHRRRTRTVPGRPDLQDSPRWRRRLLPTGLPAHAGPMGRCPADDRGFGPDTGPSPAGRTAQNPARPRQRRHGIQFTPQPPLPAKTLVRHTIPEPKDQRANRRRRGREGGRQHACDGHVISNHWGEGDDA
ncbi:transposase [Streptomyces sp. T12]|nr:transposase [Streptomyces sp. T12]